MKTKSKVINNYNGTATINEKRKKREKLMKKKMKNIKNKNPKHTMIWKQYMMIYN